MIVQRFPAELVEQIDEHRKLTLWRRRHSSAIRTIGANELLMMMMMSLFEEQSCPENLQSKYNDNRLADVVVVRFKLHDNYQNLNVQCIA
ncbi:hypothetical protein AVEN_131183-1 [Araneus ventricosus]|uniref:Uncharacterized protein n=1 Tax=Araneus ventricosus TaxID=182803 RepID=A0A4Y2MNQ0_ARAVE|nr:hypothetical protein AVEN_131183-1 [Araneus ventricosus]